MTEGELKNLQMGDIIRHAGSDKDPAWQSYVVTGNYGDHVTAVRTVDVANPQEWILVAKAALRFG